MHKQQDTWARTAGVQHTTICHRVHNQQIAQNQSTSVQSSVCLTSTHNFSRVAVNPTPRKYIITVKTSHLFPKKIYISETVWPKNQLADKTWGQNSLQQPKSDHQRLHCQSLFTFIREELRHAFDNATSYTNRTDVDNFWNGPMNSDSTCTFHCLSFGYHITTLKNFHRCLISHPVVCRIIALPFPKRVGNDLHFGYQMQWLDLIYSAIWNMDGCTAYRTINESQVLWRKTNSFGAMTVCCPKHWRPVNIID